MMLKNIDHDVHILKILLLFCTLLMKMMNLPAKLIENRHAHVKRSNVWPAIRIA